MEGGELANLVEKVTERAFGCSIDGRERLEAMTVMRSLACHVTAKAREAWSVASEALPGLSHSSDEKAAVHVACFIGEVLSPPGEHTNRRSRFVSISVMAELPIIAVETGENAPWQFWQEYAEKLLPELLSSVHGQARSAALSPLASVSEDILWKLIEMHPQVISTCLSTATDDEAQSARAAACRSLGHLASMSTMSLLSTFPDSFCSVLVSAAKQLGAQSVRCDPFKNRISPSRDLWCKKR